MVAGFNLENLASNHTTGILCEKRGVLLTIALSSDTKYENFPKEICYFYVEFQSQKL